MKVLKSRLPPESLHQTPGLIQVLKTASLSSMALQVRLCGALLLCSIIFCTVESSVFDFLDTNNNGTVAKPELYAGMKKLQFNKTKAEMDALFRQIDSNACGSLTSAEVEAFMDRAADIAALHVGDMTEVEEETINEFLSDNQLSVHLSAQDVFDFREGVNHQ
ncbi:uncharacterized protein ACB058_018462 [Synchiropus picturatus]